MLGNTVRSATFARVATVGATGPSMCEQVGRTLGKARAVLPSQISACRCLELHLLLADVDQLLEIDWAELGRIREPVGRRGARMQDLERRARALGKAEGEAGTGVGRAVLIDGKQDLDELHRDPSLDRSRAGPGRGP